jgi:hypothetical protein
MSFEQIQHKSAKIPRRFHFHLDLRWNMSPKAIWLIIRIIATLAMIALMSAFATALYGT